MVEWRRNHPVVLEGPKLALNGETFRKSLMELLCSNDRQPFAELPLEERKDLWLFGMENTKVFIERGQW